MKIEKLETIRLEYTEDIFCDITPSIEDGDIHDFWLHKKGTGESLYMFGVSIGSTEEAVSIALAGIPDYIGALILPDTE